MRTCIFFDTANELMAHLQPILQTNRHLWLVDSSLRTLPCLTALDLRDVLFLPAGEASKDWGVLELIFDRMIQMQGCCMGVVCMGGGATLDVGALAAHLFKRGVALINIPTTLLAMVDASLGGKCGVNWRGYKNMIGAIHEPEQIITCYEILGLNLKANIVKDGLSEVYKHALLGSRELMVLLQQFMQEPQIEILKKLIPIAAAVKLDVVEREKMLPGIRHLLNLGHTVAHGLEASYFERGMTISHGRAVAIGLVVERWLQVSKNQESERGCKEMAQELMTLIEQWPVIDSKQLDGAIDAMRYDKKGDGNKIIVSKFGEPFKMINQLSSYLLDVDKHEIKDAWHACESFMA